MNSNSGALGVPKQLTLNTTPPLEVDPVVSQQVPTGTPVVVAPTTPTTPTTLIKTQTNTSEESFVNWYYVLPFVGLAILGILVYRLKQQNLKSL
jgi:hypothetical protein